MLRGTPSQVEGPALSVSKGTKQSKTGEKDEIASISEFILRNRRANFAMTGEDRPCSKPKGIH